MLPTISGIISWLFIVPGGPIAPGPGGHIAPGFLFFPVVCWVDFFAVLEGGKVGQPVHRGRAQIGVGAPPQPGDFNDYAARARVS